MVLNWSLNISPFRSETRKNTRDMLSVLKVTVNLYYICLSILSFSHSFFPLYRFLSLFSFLLPPSLTLSPSFYFSLTLPPFFSLSLSPSFSLNLFLSPSFSLIWSLQCNCKRLRMYGQGPSPSFGHIFESKYNSQYLSLSLINLFIILRN